MKNSSRVSAPNKLHGTVALLLCLTLVFRVMTLNFPSYFSFIPPGALDAVETLTSQNHEKEYSPLKALTEIPPAMVKDSSESNDDTFSRSTKYPVLLLLFLAFAKLFATTMFGKLHAAFSFAGNRPGKLLSFLILRI